MSDSAFRPGSDEEWEALLHQLRLQPKAEPQPFFYARVHARLLAASPPAKTLLPSWVWRPAYAVVLGALVLAVSGDVAGSATTSTSHRTSFPAQ